MTRASIDQETQDAAAFLDHAIKELAGRRDAAATRVLDLGCGSGWLVHALSSLGYDAYGCDVEPFWEEGGVPDPRRYSLISRSPYRLPFDEGLFDVVVTTTVLEHAQNKQELFEEIHRVLAVGGTSFHVFPSKWYLPVEPHIHVPLVNQLWPHCPSWWLRLWAFLGVRNEFQAGKPWRVVARLNIDFCRDGIAYWSNRRYRAISLKTFGNYETPMLFYVSHGYGGLARLLRRLPAPAITSKMAGALRMSFIMQRKERRS